MLLLYIYVDTDNLYHSHNPILHIDHQSYYKYVQDNMLLEGPIYNKNIHLEIHGSRN